MSNLVHRRRRCARIGLHSILLPGGQYARGQVFIYVYRLAIDAMTRKGDDVTGRKCPSLLEDFQTGTTSMARKRHLHQAQGVFLVYVLLPDRT